MTDRVAGYYVALDRDVRDDADDPIRTALMMVKGVIGVEPIVSDPSMFIAEMRAETEWREKIIDLVRPKDAHA